MNSDQIIRILRKLGSIKFRTSTKGVYSNCPLHWRHEKGKDNNPSLFVFSTPIGKESAAFCHSCSFKGTMQSLVWATREGGNTNAQSIIELIDKYEMGESNIVGEDGFKDYSESLKDYGEIPNYVKTDSKLKQAVSNKKIIESQYIIPRDGKEIIIMEYGEERKNLDQEEIDRMIIPYIKEVPRYWYKRGYSEDFADFFNIGLQKNFLYRKLKKGKHYYIDFGERLLIPIKDINQRYVGWSARTMSEKSSITTIKGPHGNPLYKTLGSPKYLHCPTFKRNNYLYGENLLDKNLDYCIVTEGFFDTIQLYCFGYRNIVALMGTHMSPIQLSKIRNSFKKIILFLDGDKAGINATQEVIKKYGQEVDFTSADINLYMGLDPGDLNKEQANNILSKLIN